MIVYIPYGEFTTPFVWLGITYHPVVPTDDLQVSEVPQAYRDYLAAEEAKRNAEQGNGEVTDGN